MNVKLRQTPHQTPAHPVRDAVLAVAGILVTLVLLVAGVTFSYYYYKYKSVVDERLAKPLFTQTARIYAAPLEVRAGQKLTPASIALSLRNAGYSEEGQGTASPLGTYSLHADSIAIHPGAESYHSQEGATISFANGKVSQLTGDQGQEVGAYELEPQLITGLSDANRGKRRLVSYDQLPPNLVHAVVSIEDRRFFEHHGVDWIRLIGAVRDDLRAGRKREGGSTLTMQLARGFFLTPEKRFKRKIIEIAITFQLENHYSKQKIFELYANQINLGQQGSFAINGFGQAAQTYFGKDVKQLTLPECATLAGMIQHPSYLNPYRHPERTIARRNVVLDAMVETGAITKAQDEAAKAEPLKLASMSMDAGEAPYFVDLVRDRLTQKLGDTAYNSEGLRIYTSLDPDLQRIASESVAEGMKRVDAMVERRRERLRKAGSTETIPNPQVALIALNPHTGQVLALVGGRNYGMSQFDHAVSHRPTGSVFKPFVYAAAFNSSLSGAQLVAPSNDEANAADAAAESASGGQVQQVSAPASNWQGIFTAVTPLNNDLQVFDGGYTPGNYHDVKYVGQVTARTALALSLNNATVELAQMVGYNNVASLAREAGIKNARGTPAVALGAYDASPLDVAGAYTMFANGGVHIDPWFLASVRTPSGEVMQNFPYTPRPILDPRVAYLTLSLMQNVINVGTASAVRQVGFLAPAAGKTGTSHDAWFAGFTSNLLCIIWIGNDDYSDIKLEGAHTAAPMWGEFMKKATELPQYSDTRDFIPPSGVTILRIDRATNLLADPTCPQDFYAAFLDGTAPNTTCSQGPPDSRNLFQKIFGLGGKPNAPNLPTQPQTQQVIGAPAQPPQVTQAAAPAPQPQPEEPKKKRGFFSRIFGGKKDDQQNQQQQQQPQQ